MKNIDADKLKAEIKRLEEMDYPCDTLEQSTGFYDALDRIKSFIDSLQQEQPSLNDAAFDYAELCKYEGADKLLCAEHFKAGAEWMAGQGTRKEE